MRKESMRWLPGILLVVVLFVAGCTDKKNEETLTRGPGETMTQAPGQDGTTSPEAMQPDTAREQMPEQKEKQT